MPPIRAPLQSILLVKTSSMGDVIHNLPVVEDLCRHYPALEIDWVVEESFAALPRLHPAVRNVIPVALRRWRKQIFCRTTWQEVRETRHRLSQKPYDAVLDTQGLLKSALIARQARGLHLGYSRAAAREPLAARFYTQRFFVPKTLHAVERNRRLAAAALGYSIGPEINYGLPGYPDTEHRRPEIFMLTATSREDKLWPENHWITLGTRLMQLGFQIRLPSGSPHELARAHRIAEQIKVQPGLTQTASSLMQKQIEVLPPLSLPELATRFTGAAAIIGVDTGLSHLGAALGTPTIALYTATEPGLTGVLGQGWHRNLGGRGKVPTPAEVLDTLQPILAADHTR